MCTIPPPPAALPIPKPDQTHPPPAASNRCGTSGHLPAQAKPEDSGVAEERKRGLFNRLFGLEEEQDGPPTPPEVAGQEAPELRPSAPVRKSYEANEDGRATGTRMSDGQVVPEFPPPDNDEALNELAAALPELLEQLRTESAITPPPAAPLPAPGRSGSNG